MKNIDDLDLTLDLLVSRALAKRSLPISDDMIGLYYNIFNSYTPLAGLYTLLDIELSSPIMRYILNILVERIVIHSPIRDDVERLLILLNRQDIIRKIDIILLLRDG